MTEKPIHVLLAKADKFSRSQAALEHVHGALRRDYAALSPQRFAGATHESVTAAQTVISGSMQ